MDHQNNNEAVSYFDLMDAVRNFLRLEAAGGIFLMIAASVAIVIANTPLYWFYDYVFNAIQFRIGFDEIHGDFNIMLKKSNLLWINDGFMAVFFFLVGLEIKREVLDGELSSRARALLPAMGAVGGMIMPALIYYLINMNSPETIAGWAIPAATDIAFALGVLALLGSRVPTSLKILLTAIAVIDDLGAILIIAIFYSHGMVITPLYFALVTLVGLIMLNMNGVRKPAPYIILGLILWVAVLKSGVHATIAGVVTALFIPDKSDDPEEGSMCYDMMHALHPWVAYGILPIFAFANAGVPFAGMGLESFGEPVTLGILLGLLVGKPLGIFTTLFVAIKSGLAPMPSRASWRHLFAVSILCGIGFTMSLFIGGLAFEGIHLQASVRLGVLCASIIAAVIGYLILRSIPESARPAISGPQ